MAEEPKNTNGSGAGCGGAILGLLGFALLVFLLWLFNQVLGPTEMPFGV